MIVRKQTKSGPRFKVFINRGAERHYAGTFTSEKEALKAERHAEVTRDKIDAGELPEQVDTTRTLETAAGEWIKSLVNRKSRSAAGYQTRLELYILPRLGNVALTDLAQPHVMAMRDELAVRYAPATVNGILICLSSAFTYFGKRQWVGKNPCQGVEPIEDPVTSYNWIRTTEEMTRLLAACADDLRDMVATALATGLRLDEMLHLQWADVDLKKRLITVHRGRQGTVKSGKVRHVPILDSLLPTLQARALRRGGAVLVFPGRKGAVRTKQGVGTIYKLALKRAGLDESLRWHDLRHSMASHWMASGGCIFRLSKILGHSSVRITEQRYAHLAPEAFEQDYHRVSFHVPDEPAKLYELKRDGEGKIVGRSAVRAIG